MADGDYIASVDIGSSKVVVLIADRLDDGLLEVVGHAKGVSEGVIRGEIVDVDALVSVIKTVANKAGKSCNSEFDSVIVNISDPNLRVFNLTPNKHVDSDLVKKSDVEALMRTAEAQRFKETEQRISSITHHYILDKDSDTEQGVVVKRPIGEQADMLEASVHIVVAAKQRVKNIERSLGLCGFQAQKLVINSMASSEPYLTPAQKDDGVCLVDVGAGVVDLSVFKQGRIFYSTAIQVGAEQVTWDIANAFNTPFAEAERLKLEHGQAQVKTLERDMLIDFRQNDDAADYCLSHESLIEVIEESYKALLLSIKKKIQEEDKNLYRSIKGFVFVGGGVKIEGYADLAFDCLKKRVRVGHVNREVIRLNPNSVSSNENLLAPEYACALGLLLFNDEELGYKEEQLVNKGGIKSAFKNLMSSF
ncbi:Cell division protein FtsA [Bathymodiolus thermophilus thioautotrophic gill symbiont]|uniref:cell division protein FtsA n=1 Tax=Bathymodiolus thermophilus thioautotrophic gill symbiont TaxID=2360 RepID=UPI0010B47049|nr:cell division protein FtsA [Bathymodiolus thermophilus thioautotrophic gill symbiont]SHA18889.1 Cell division protein FtsA [Bathymodiolus thermophilus thioautotrophic gill symbiont]